MNLAIHDAHLLCRILSGGFPACWAGREIQPWTPPAVVRAQPKLQRYVEEGRLALLEIAPEHEGFFDIFRQRLRPGLTVREAALLFLANHTQSVVLTGERLVAEQAKSLDLRVWSGTSDEVSRHFPAVNTDPTPPFSARGIRLLLSSQFPSPRQVPAGNEPVPASRQKAGGLIRFSRGSRGAPSKHSTER